MALAARPGNLYDLMCAVCHTPPRGLAYRFDDSTKQVHFRIQCHDALDEFSVDQDFLHENRGGTITAFVAVAAGLKRMTEDRDW